MSYLDTMPGHLIRRVHQISTALFADECAASGLTPVQFAALTAIRNHPDVDATRLSSVTALDRSTLGNLLERLETKGLVERSASPDDKRIKRLRLSPSGSRVLEAAESAVRRVQHRLLVPLAPRDRIELMRLLARLIASHEPGGAGLSQQVADDRLPGDR